MKLTKKLEAEVLKAYKAYWDAYFNGDMKTFASFLDDNIWVFGTAISEVFNNKKKMLRFYKATAEQLVGKAEFRNRRINVQSLKDSVLINEQCDLYILMEEKWTFYGNARASAILKHTRSGWKLVHQHGSFPDTRAEEGEQVAAEKIKAENIQLRDAVKRRTIELEEKNRELEIETAVERVRATTNAMHRSEDLHKVIREVYDQLRLLEFRFDGVDFMTDYSDKGFNIWLAAQQHTFSAPIYVPSFGHKIFRLLKKVKKEEKDFFTFTLDREEKNKYVKHLIENTIVKNVPEKMKQHMLAAKGWTTSCVVLENIILSITNLELIPYTDAENAIIKRFAHVFQQSYTRFLDLQKAEAQARDAQIEAALERVRATSMAMHHSDDLINVINVVKEQLIQLGFHFHGANFVTDYSDKGYTMWLASPDESYPSRITVQSLEQKIFKSVNNAIEQGKDFATYTLTKKEKDLYFKNFFENTAAQKTSEENKKFAYSTKGMAASIVLLDKVRFNIMNLDVIPYTDEENSILKRLGYVFQQSYIRFLDLQKAEAQAREAKIEASLERVRSKTMAMHKSSDLLDVVKVLGEQFELLEFKFQSVNFDTDFQDRDKDWNLWLYNVGSAMYPGKIHIPYIDHPCFNRPLEAFKKGGDLHSFIFTKEEKDSLFDHIYANSVAKYGSDERKRFTYAAPGFALSIAVTKNTRITIANYYAEPFTEEENAILRRFANVFEQSYTRFLDLQKAEAQAREAQIEVAVERVRAQALAMHRSEDLHKVVVALKKELAGLHISNITAATIYLEQDDGSIRILDLSDTGEEDDDKPQLELDKVFRLEDTDPNLWIRRMWNRTDNYFVLEADEADFVRVVQFVKTVDPAGAEIAEKIIKEKSITKAWLPTVKLGRGIMNIDLLEPPGREVESILLKIGAGFDLAYKRFLDLQKAEAQAREAQIEAALERVRSRTMAMQKTDELLDAAELVHKELAVLGINSMNISYAFVDEDEKYGSYYSINPVDGRILPIPFVFPHTETEVMRSILASWKKQESYNVIELKEKATLKHQTYIGEHIQRQLAKNNIPFSIGDFLAMSPKKAVLSTFNFANGYLFNIGGERLLKTQEELMLRFTRVFEQTYTRFLDLQKAEAQAREAQIEAALERVRSRTMGMQKSEELKEVIQVVYEQFVHLNIHVEHTGFIIDYKARDDMNIWLADKHAVPFQITLPYFDCAHWNSFKEAKEKGIDFFANQLSFEEKNKFYQDLFKLIPGVPEETLEYYFSCPGLAISTVLLENVGLYIENFWGIPYTDEENKTLMRFGKVFQQTYTRFLDLQKAEAQAREAQIETALEKVRSHTMGMRTSDDLANVATVMFDQMRILGGDLFSFGIVLCNRHEDMVEQWHSIPHAGMLAPFFVPVDLDHIHRYRYDQWKAGVELFSVVIPEDYISHHFDLMLELPSVKSVWEGIAAKGIPLPAIPTWEIDYGASFRYGYLLVSALKPFEEDKIFPRFAKVFEQAYTRFLDLQKAEAQAREAQIEVSLERVRSKAMAMHKTEDLTSAVSVVFDELDKLQLGMLRCGIGILHKDKRTADVWTTAKSETGTNIQTSGDEPMDIHPLLQGDFDAWLRQEEFSYILEGKDLENYYQVLTETNFQLPESASFETIKKDQKQYYYVAPFELGTFFAFRESEFSPEAKSVMKRFANVFNLTYKRFLDLQKAEAQTRESQIELGLERVRARAMAMQNSDELKELIGTVFIELTKLDLVLTRCLIVIFDPKTNGSTWWMANSEAPSDPIGLYVKYHDHPPYLSYVKAWQERNLKWQYILEEKNKKDWDDFLFVETELSHLPDFVIAGMKAPERVYLNASFNSFGNLTLASLEPLSNEHFDILLRFAKVFDLTYTRFNDLKQAEAQAREAQIELGLERVRARAMAMQNSDELSELVDTVFKELTKLDFALTWCIINIIDESSLSNTVWAANPDINKAPESYHMLFEDYPFHHAMMKGWKERKTKDVYVLEGQEKKVYDEYLFNETEFRKVPEAAQAASRAMEKYVVTFSFSNFGGLQTVGDVPLSDASLDILSRFGKVFDLTYTRFNDLKQAEAQARESQIQLALERVRARTMAMQKSDELRDAALLLINQVQSLGVPPFACGFNIWDDDRKEATAWMARENTLLPPFKTSSTEDVFLQIYEAAQKGESLFVVEQRGQVLETHYKYMVSIPIFREMAETMAQAGQSFPTFQIIHCAFFSHGYLMFISYEPVPEAHDIFKRFAKVFEQTYTRFLDLQKAEAQTRESQIQLALERVRARTMAMQKSDELPEASYLLFQQVKELGETTVQNSIAIVNEEAGFVELSTTVQGHHLPHTLHVPINDPYVMSKAVAAWKAKRKSLKLEFAGQELKDYNEHRNSFFETKVNFPEDQWIVNIIFFSKGWLSFSSDKNISDETFELLKRFAAVFEQTYIRFNDLKQAEEQAREAKIEAALERVRSRSMAMHKSDELREVVAVLFAQLQHLGFDITFCSIALIDKINSTVEFWLSGFSQEILPESYHVPNLEHSFYQNFQKTFREGIPYKVFELAGEEKRSYDKLWFTLTDFKKLPEPVKKPMMEMERVVLSCAFTKNGMIQIGGFEPLSDTDALIIQRFAKVFEQTYTRFLDLQKAEAQTREAQVETALERVRSRTLAMHKSEELAETAVVLFKQMIGLGIEPNRLYIAIINDDSGDLEFWITDENGEKVSSRYMVNIHKNISIKKMHEGWAAKKKTIAIDMQGKELEDWLNYWKEEFHVPFKPGAALKRRVQNIAYFSKGFVAIASPDDQPESTINLLERFAAVFNLTYTRFNDLKIAEAHALQAEEDLVKLHTEKRRTEEALAVLQATQKQLIQSEKMASLGELTAGIAHEIQNPLNFVNNFSEVSNELIEEMKEELAKGNWQLANEIAEDVKQNLEKINHHGKRADGIVKGMLQHSRTSSGQKEPTDINVLAEEYLRLAYHGLRAKDKSFNAKFETDFDPTINKIDLVQQDIGRVMLNLINNAFYAVDEKKKQVQNGYEPIVTINTKKLDDTIEIAVKDNGNGIPKKVLDKIFQPFFTTKPTGQGTGLGLSLAYDIIKTHGGELKVDTEEGKGANFIISIPIIDK